MKREFDRYAVIKWSDAQKCLSVDEQKQLVAMGKKFQQHRRNTDRPWECLVVEHDWPEYERVWNMIEARVEGHVEENIDLLRRKAAAFDMLTELMGYVQNGTDGVLTLFQDDATLSYWISHRTAGKTNYDWQEYGNSFEQVIKTAFEKHGGVINHENSI